MAEVRYPRTWKDMSLDMKLFFGYHVSMMAMMFAGGPLTARAKLIMAATILALIFFVSRDHRQKRHWRWPGVKLTDVLYAVGGIALVSFFLYSASPSFPPDSRMVPWYLAGFGIGLFGLLQSLKVVYPSEADFTSHCMIIDQDGREVKPVPEPPPPPEPTWKRFTKAAYKALFMLVWICGVASFYFFGTAIKNGSPQPTATQTEPMEDHGNTVYVTAAEKQRVHALQLAAGVGLPVVLLSGVILHFLVGVKLFQNTPTLSEYLNREKQGSGPS